MGTHKTGVVGTGREEGFEPSITEALVHALDRDGSPGLFDEGGDASGGLSVNQLMLLSGRLLQEPNLPAEVRGVIDALRRRLWELQKDVLTGHLNQTSFREKADAEFSYVRRKDGDLACIFIDIDKFKGLNDGYGHGAGDAVIAKLGEVIRMIVRSYDVVGRDGGDEIVILLRDVGEDYACALTERICAEVSRMEVEYSGKKLPAVTISCGVAVISPKDVSFDDLRGRADRALYEAKSNGRNAAYMADFVEGDGGEYGDCEVYAPCRRC